MSNPKATTTIPAPLRFIITTIEPTTTLYGVYVGLFRPEILMPDYFSRGTIAYVPETKCLYTQLAGMWALFAFMHAVVLRSFDDLALWRRVCLGSLLCDVFYYHAVAEGVGGWGEFLDFGVYTGWDWYTLLASLALSSARLMVVLGVGVKGGVDGKVGGRKEKLSGTTM